MKYLKTYEINKYEEGDYVVVYDSFGKITTISTKYYPGRVKIVDYIVHIFDNDIDIPCKKYEIRPATKKEIEEFEIKNNINKYNL